MKKHLLCLLALAFSSIAFAQSGFEQKMKHAPAPKRSVATAGKTSGKEKPPLDKDSLKSLSQGPLRIIPEGRAQSIKTKSPLKLEIRPGSKETPALIRVIDRLGGSIKSKNSIPDACKLFIEELRPYMNISDDASFKIDKVQEDVVRMFQYYKGIELYGYEVLVHLDKSGNGKLLTGRYSSCFYKLDTSYAITAQQALAKVWEDMAQKTTIMELSEAEKEFSHYHGPESKRVIYEGASGERVSWEIMLKPNILEAWHYVIDGKTGKVLNAYTSLCSVDGSETASAVDLHGISRTINTRFTEGTYYLEDIGRSMYDASREEGAIFTLNAEDGSGQAYNFFTSTDNNWNSPVAVSAHYNAGEAFEYFHTNHGRNSINGSGGNIYSFVNVTQNGEPMDNAYWNGQAIFYGNGDEYFYPLARALDVAGHEMSHG
ncbi:MAG: PepSY domain-containing protein, partial [Cytophagaceae bacterium]